MFFFFFFKQKTAYEMRISDWSSDVCSSDLHVSSAYGEDGFLGRWTGYARDGHGGNIGLKSRELSDYQVSILEVCGSGLTVDEIIRVEALWKAKLQSREMGLNKN